MTTTNNAINTGLSGSTGTGSFVGSASPTITGTLTFPTPFTLGATSVTSTGTQLNYLNGLTSKPINKIANQIFTSSGTYTPTTGMVYCIIECVGSGGGGGGCVNSAGGASGGGGGSGGYSRKIADAATIGLSQSVTINAAGTGGAAGNNPGNPGGDVSVGVICVAKGGGGGGGGSTGTPGAGGVAGTGDLTLVGNKGGDNGNSGIINTTCVAGLGAGSYFGGSPGLHNYNTTAAGANATNYGAGGNAGTSFNNGGTSAGGNGSSGIVIITEFVSA